MQGCLPHLSLDFSSRPWFSTEQIYPPTSFHQKIKGVNPTVSRHFLGILVFDYVICCFRVALIF